METRAMETRAMETRAMETSGTESIILAKYFNMIYPHPKVL